MAFEEAARLGSYLARPYAEGMLRLLATYRDISASEAASRLGIHINTAQEFLEGLAALDIVTRHEVREGKRPYFRYALKEDEIRIAIDLAALRPEVGSEVLNRRIRERPGTDARFSRSRDDEAISSVTIWMGDGRERQERRISLTAPQGRFLFHLPMPDEDPMSVLAIMKEAKVDAALSPEIVDLVQLLDDFGVVEVSSS